MARLEDGRIVETPAEARQGERGPSVLMLLTASLAEGGTLASFQLLEELPYLIEHHPHLTSFGGRIPGE
jgi:hypothetical protein